MAVPKNFISDGIISPMIIKGIGPMPIPVININTVRPIKGNTFKTFTSKNKTQPLNIKQRAEINIVPISSFLRPNLSWTLADKNVLSTLATLTTMVLINMSTWMSATSKIVTA